MHKRSFYCYLLCLFLTYQLNQSVNHLDSHTVNRLSSSVFLLFSFKQFCFQTRYFPEYPNYKSTVNNWHFRDFNYLVGIIFYCIYENLIYHNKCKKISRCQWLKYVTHIKMKLKLFNCLAHRKLGLVLTSLSNTNACYKWPGKWHGITSNMSLQHKTTTPSWSQPYIFMVMIATVELKDYVCICRSLWLWSQP